MTLLSNLFNTSNYTYTPKLNFNSIFTIPFQIAQSIINAKIQLIDKIFDPFNLFNPDQITTKSALINKIAELVQNSKASANVDALRTSILNVAESKYALLGIPKDSVKSYVDAVINDFKAGKFTGTKAQIADQLNDILSFGAILDTPDAVLQQISTVIANLPSIGSPKALELIKSILDSKGKLLNLGTTAELLNQIQTLLQSGKLIGTPEQIYQQLKEVLDFGAVLTTPDDVLSQISKILANLPSIGSGQGFSLIDSILKSKANLLNLPSIDGLTDAIKTLFNSGKLSGTADQILEKLRDVLNFGSVLETPDAILDQISNIIANIPQLGTNQGFDLVKRILDAKANLLNIPSITTFTDKIKALIDAGDLTGSPAQILEKIKEVLNFGDILDTPDAIFEQISNIIANLPQFGSEQGLNLIQNILNSKANLLNIPSITPYIDQIKSLIESGSLAGTPQQILEKLREVFNFGTLLDTPDAVLNQISNIISNLPQFGTVNQGLDLIKNLLNSKLNLLNIPSATPIVEQIKSLIESGSLVGSPEQIAEKLRDVFNFGSLLETPDAVLDQVSNIIAKIPQTGLDQGFNLIKNLLDAKAKLFNIPSITEFTDKIKSLLNSGDLAGTPNQILEKLKEVLNFGDILDTPDAVFESITNLLNNLPKLGELPTLETIQNLLEQKADLLNLPSVTDAFNRIQELVQNGLPNGSDLLDRIKDIFNPETAPEPTEEQNLNDDQYFLTTPNDPILEVLNGGVDTVFSQFNYKLGANVENLTLLGSNKLVGEGNELDNVIQGNLGSNVLQGYAGDDVLIANAGLTNVLNGGTGNDALFGGVGSETYEFELGFGVDTITEKGGSADTIKFGEGISVNDLLVNSSGKDLVISLQNGQDQITIKDWAVSAKNKVEFVQFHTGDRLDLTTVDQQLTFG